MAKIMSPQEIPVSGNDLTTTHDFDTNNDDLDLDYKKSTPLPVLPLLSVFLIQLAEPVTATVIYPFINQFVRETGITGGDEKKTGHYAGMESAFFFAESLTVVQWGYLSDRYGRRPILLCGPLGLALGMLIFGTSTTFWPLVWSRCLQGIFNGNIGVTKSVIAELTDLTNRGDAYAIIPMMWSFGVTTGPILGGIFSNPAIRWPDTLGRIPYLRAHPYFLPCFIAAAFSVLTFIVSYLTLKETLPSLVAKERLLRHQNHISNNESTTAESQLINHSDNHNYSTDCVQPVAGSLPVSTHDETNSNNLRSVFTRPIVMILINNTFHTFLAMCYTVLMPLMYSTPIDFGGLGLDPYRIGVTLGTFGVINSVVQGKLLGRLIKKYGGQKLYKFTFCSYLVCFGMYPILRFLAQRAGGVDSFVIVGIAIQLGCQMCLYMAYGAIQVILIENIPEGGPMGTLNGVAQMLGSGMRSLAPALVSSLFSISLQRDLAGGNMVYYILIAITFLGIYCTSLLPKNNRPNPRPTQTL